MPALPGTIYNPTSENLLRADMRAEFLATYRSVRAARNPLLQRIMRVGVPSRQRTEHYGYYESTPTVDRLGRMESVHEEGFKAIAYSVTNVTWGKAVGFAEEDVEDDMLGDPRQVARGLGRRAAEIAEEVAFQIFSGSASSRLLESIPTAPDGAALHATTAGGANRFGVSGGNVLTGSGLGTGADVRGDFWAAVTRALQFQDTAGQPLHADGVLDQGVTIVYPVQHMEVFAEAFQQARPAQVVQNTAFNDNVAAAAVSNPLHDANMRITLWATPRLTGDDWYVQLDGVQPATLLEQVRRPPRMIDDTRENSERARWTRVLASLLDMRSGFGVNLPYGSLKVDN